MSHKYFIIAEYAHHGDAWEYVSAVGQLPHDTWTTLVPYGHTGEPPKPPIRFETKLSAQRVLAPLKAARLMNWEKDSWYYRAHGRKKPSWKIYSME
jgi:hypothetical protein